MSAVNTTKSNTAPQPSNVEPLVVSAEDAAVMLGISRATVYRLMDAGELPYASIGRQRRIPVRSIHAILDKAVEEAAKERQLKNVV